MRRRTVERRAARGALAAAAGLVVLAAGAAAACHHGSSSDAGSLARTAPDTVTGQVRQVGSTPFVRTIVSGEDTTVRVTGPYEAELSRVTGARVRVVGGPAEETFPEPALRVTSYEILSVDGAEPLVGRLRRREGRGYYLEMPGGREAGLSTVPDGLRGRVGAKIWVVLSEQGVVQRYGVLREPS